MRPRLITETRVEARACLRRGPAGHWAVNTPKQFLVLDPRLDVALRVDLPYAGHAVHAVMPGLDGVALALDDRVQLLDGRGRTWWEFPHRPWADGESGCVQVLSDGTVWATSPGEDGRDHWQVLDGTDGTLLTELVLDAHGSGAEPTAHPWLGAPAPAAGPPAAGAPAAGPPAAGSAARPPVGLTLVLPMGAEGPRFQLYRASRGPGGPALERLPGDRHTLADIRPGGDRYLTMAGDHSELRLHATIGHGVLASCRAGEVLDGDDLFDFGAAFVTPQVVLVRPLLAERHVLLDAARLDVLDVVDYPQGTAHDMVASTGDGTWVTADWWEGSVRHWSA